jgi:hypothetical protein
MKWRVAQNGIYRPRAPAPIARGRPPNSVGSGRAATVANYSSGMATPAEATGVHTGNPNVRPQRLQSRRTDRPSCIERSTNNVDPQRSHASTWVTISAGSAGVMGCGADGSLLGVGSGSGNSGVATTVFDMSWSQDGPQSPERWHAVCDGSRLWNSTLRSSAMIDRETSDTQLLASPFGTEAALLPRIP